MENKADPKDNRADNSRRWAPKYLSDDELSVLVIAMNLIGQVVQFLPGKLMEVQGDLVYQLRGEAWDRAPPVRK